MRVTLDACVPCFLLTARVLIPAYVLSQYRIRHVVFVLKEYRRAHLSLLPTAAFDHDFGAVTDSDDPLMKSYSHLM